jgi:hypothetical protein
MLSPSQIAASAPATQQQFGGVSTVNPDTYSAADVNASYIPGALQASEDLNAQALAPQFQQQDMSLDDNLASRGIVDSGAATYLNQNLAGNQSAALASADAPLISQYAGYNQADQLSNQSAQNTAAEYNATAGNAAAVQNADAYNAMNQGNTNAYNSWLDTIEGQGSNYGNTLEQNFAGTYGNLDSTALNSLNPSSTISAYENGLNNSGSGFGNAFSAGLSALTNQSNNGQGTQSSPTITAAPDDDINNYLGYYG